MRPGAAKQLLFSLIPGIVVAGLAEAGLRLFEPAWMGCVRTRACPHPEHTPRYVTEQRHNFTLETGEPLLVYHPRLFWWPRAHVRGTVWSTHHVRTNSLGLRGPEPRKGLTNVLVVGDSVVWGSLVEEHERFTEVAQDRLRAALPGIQVINAGVVGFSSFQALRFLHEKGWRLFSPRVVVVCVGVNDAWRALWTDEDQARRDGRLDARLRGVLRGSDLFLLLERSLTEAILWARTGRNPQGIAFLYAPTGPKGRTHRVVPAGTLAHMRAMGTLARRGGASLVVILQATRQAHPSGWDPEVFHEARRLVGEWARAEGWPVLDASDLARLPWSGPEDHLRDFCHLSPGGHRVVGEWVAACVESLLASGGHLHGAQAGGGGPQHNP